MFEYINYVIAPLKIIKDKIFDYTFYYDGKDINEILGKTPRIFDRLSSAKQCEYFFGEPTHIIDNIYLGSAFNAASFYKLKELNIDLIINVTSEISEYYPDDFQYKKYNLYDNNKDTIDKYLDESYNEIEEYNKKNKENKNILIHCFMGASRSASIVIYYILNKYGDKKDKIIKQIGMKENFNDNDNKKDNLTINEVIEFIKNKRGVINPTEKLILDINLKMDINYLKNNREI